MSPDELSDELDKAYANTAKNCLITTLCYVFTLAKSCDEAVLFAMSSHWL